MTNNISVNAQASSTRKISWLNVLIVTSILTLAFSGLATIILISIGDSIQNGATLLYFARWTALICLAGIVAFFYTGTREKF